MLTAMQPNQYAAVARVELFDEIDKRRQEAHAIRPRLAALAVRWPDAALELNESSATWASHRVDWGCLSKPSSIMILSPRC